MQVSLQHWQQRLRLFPARRIARPWHTDIVSGPKQVHKIAQLDIRMANTDRNGGNILACHGADGRWELVAVRPHCNLICGQ